MKQLRALSETRDVRLTSKSELQTSCLMLEDQLERSIQQMDSLCLHEVMLSSTETRLCRDDVAKWLRRWTAKPIVVDSNPILVDLVKF